MNGSLKRAFALCLALMLALGMVNTVLAVEAEGTYELTKYLVMDENAITPAVTFSFAVSSDDSCKQDADMANNIPQIMKGIGTPTIANIAFTAGQTTYTAAESVDGTTPATSGITAAQFTDGKYAKGTGAISFAGINFDQPGIYRYIITESFAGGNSVDGVSLENPATRFMDVYVSNKDDTSEDLVVSSVIIHKENTNTTNGTGVTEKDKGFINSYTTYDLSLTKTVTGNQGYRGKYFKFTVVISGAAPGTQFALDGDLNEAPAGATAATITSPLTMPASGNLTATFYLKNGQTVNILGLTSATSYNITENIEDSEGYTVSRSIEGGTVVGENTKSTGTVTMGESDDAVTFENNRQGVVPTGILLDIWPYILIVAVAAAALIILIAKRRKHEDQD